MPFWVAFNYFVGIGPARFKVLLNFFKTAKNAYEAPAEIWNQLGLPQNIVNNFLKFRQEFNPQEKLDEIYQKKITILTLMDKDYSQKSFAYPERLRHISDAPPVLYVKGELKPEDSLAIGIVGTRKITGYGREVTEVLTRDLVANGLTIVSGLAR